MAVKIPHPSMRPRKLDQVPIVLPATEASPAQIVKVNFRLTRSSNVTRVGWDAAKNMYVEFKGGSLYVYPNVSRQRAVACAYSKSVGGYIAEQFRKTKHPFVRLF
jgi:hypothetical protein